MVGNLNNSQTISKHYTNKDVLPYQHHAVVTLKERVMERTVAPFAWQMRGKL
jgi:hypothetical protein